MGSLTKNFSLWEFEASQEATRRGIDNSVPQSLIPHIHELAEWLQVLRDGLSKKYNRDVSIVVSSGYRSPKLNRAIGGSSKSHHMKGVAADIRASGLTPQELFEFICRGDAGEFDQCIQEFNSWVHLSIGLRSAKKRKVARMQKLKASKIKSVFGRLKTRYEVVA